MLTVRGADLVWDGVGAPVPGGEVVCGADGRVTVGPGGGPGARRLGVRGHARPGQRPPPPAADRVPHAPRHARGADARLAAADGRGLRGGGRRRGAGPRRGGRRAGRGAAVRGDDRRRPPPHLAARRRGGHRPGRGRRGGRAGGASGVRPGECPRRPAGRGGVGVRDRRGAAAAGRTAWCRSPSGRRGCTATGRRRSRCSARSPRGTGCGGGRRRASRSTSRSRRSGTGGGRWSCSTSGGGWPPTSPSRTCAG